MSYLAVCGRARTGTGSSAGSRQGDALGRRLCLAPLPVTALYITEHLFHAGARLLESNGTCTIVNRFGIKIAQELSFFLFRGDLADRDWSDRSHVAAICAHRILSGLYAVVEFAVLIFRRCTKELSTVIDNIFKDVLGSVT